MKSLRRGIFFRRTVFFRQTAKLLLVFSFLFTGTVHANLLRELQELVGERQALRVEPYIRLSVFFFESYSSVFRLFKPDSLRHIHAEVSAKDIARGDYDYRMLESVYNLLYSAKNAEIVAQKVSKELYGSSTSVACYAQRLKAVGGVSQWSQALYSQQACSKVDKILSISSPIAHSGVESEVSSCRELLQDANFDYSFIDATDTCNQYGLSGVEEAIKEYFSTGVTSLRDVLN